MEGAGACGIQAVKAPGRPRIPSSLIWPHHPGQVAPLPLPSGCAEPAPPLSCQETVAEGEQGYLFCSDDPGHKNMLMPGVSKKSTTWGATGLWGAFPESPHSQLIWIFTSLFDQFFNLHLTDRALDAKPPIRRSYVLTGKKPS